MVGLVRLASSNAGLYQCVGTMPVGLPRAGHELGEDSVSVLREDCDSSQGPILRPISPGPSSDGSDAPASVLLQPVQPLQSLQRRRLHARRHSTTYCYDFPAVFENALRAIWASHSRRGGATPSDEAPVQSTELVLDGAALPGGEGNFAMRDAPLRQVSRDMGLNNVGMVVWQLTLRTPEWPQGRSVIVVANDITHGAGAFGPREHAVFRAACDHAVAQRLPLVYLAANSGARVGLDQGLKKLLQVRFTCKVHGLPCAGGRLLQGHFDAQHCLHSIARANSAQ